MITSESFRSQSENLKTETHKRKINNVVFKDLELGLTVRKERTMHGVYVNSIQQGVQSLIHKVSFPYY
jgi:hypothetical protein